jgi:amino acid transporter/mannitol/fructose-specific phosphotransferase system IIA component (Ntr-type)
VIAISMGAMLGSGIFVLPGIAATISGPSVALAYLIAAICVLPAALSKAELATAMPTSGGTYVYISRAFGLLPGTISGIGLWLSLLFKSAFALVGLSAYLKVFAPRVDMVSASLGVLVGVTLLNVVGVRAVSRMQTFVVGAALLFLLFLSAAGTRELEMSHFENFFSGGFSGLIEAAAFVSVSFAGVTKVAAIAEEVRDPGRNLPLGMLFSLGLVSVVYVCVVTVLIGVVPIEQLSSTSKADAIPMVHLSEHIWGATGGVLAAVLGVLTMASMANSGLLASSRFPFAMSRDKLLPPLFMKIHPRLLTPYSCIIATGAVMALAILFLDVVRLAKLASAFMLLLFMIENATVIVFRTQKPDWYKPEFRSPFYPLVQIVGIVVGAVLINRLGSIALYGTVGVSICGVLVFYLYAQPQMRRREKQKATEDEDVVIDRVHAPQVMEETHLHRATTMTLLFGNERSPEKLVELGAAIAKGGHQEVVHIMEIPEQTALEAVHDDGPEFEALRRRVDRVAREWNLDVEMDGLVSHDIDLSVPLIIEEVNCNWALVEWSGPAHHNFMHSEKHWSILDHAKCNLALYRDDGVQDIRQILVFAEPDLYDDMVAQTADSIAHLFGAELTFIRCIKDGTDPILELAQVDYVDQLRMTCTSTTHSLIVYGQDELEAVQSVTKGFDLLVMGTNRPRPFVNLMRMTPKDHLAEHATCSVLRLKPQDQIAKTLSYDPDEDARLRLTDILDSNFVQTDLKNQDKDSFFRHIAGVFSDQLGVPADKIEKGFRDHEMEHNTSIGGGVALPHATVDELEHETMGVFISCAPVDFDARDGVGCDVFIVFLSAPEERHSHQVLQTQLSRFVLHTSLITKLRACKSPGEVIGVFKQAGVDLGMN